MKELLSRIIPGAFLSLIGLVISIVGLQSGQDGSFIIGGIGLLLVGIVVLLNAFQVITNQLSVIVAAVLGVGSIGLIYLNFQAINGPIQFLKEKERRYAHVIQRLKDIREAQVTYKKNYGMYAADFDSLIHFIETDSIPVVKKEGYVPDGYTQEMAVDSGYLRLDTNLTPAAQVIFNEEYLQTRYAKNRLIIDSLRYVPFTDQAEFDMETGELERTGGLKVPVFQVEDAEPFDPKEVLRVGSLSDPTTAGNWKEEK